MKIPYIFILLFICVLCFSGCFAESAQIHGSDTVPPASEPSESARALEVTAYPEPSPTISHKPEPVESEEIQLSPAEEILRHMTLKEKVGQLFITAYRKNEDGSGITGLNDESAKAIKDYHIGGVVLFSENIQTILQTQSYIADMQGIAKIPLFIGIDEEGGAVSRTGSLGFGKTPTAGDIGNTRDINLASEYSRKIAEYLLPLGFNLNFAPVADINSNPSNTVIGNRSYGSDAVWVSDMVTAVVKAYMESGIVPVIKHFPGHGDTNEDSHYGAAFTEKTLDELENMELIPFKQAISAGAPMVMAGHISAPNVTGNNEPTVFSEYLLQNILRTDLGFTGIVITDAMDMAAITDFYSSGEATVKALKAGVDIVLMPADFYEGYDAVLNAVGSGEISEEFINEKVLRILECKLKYLEWEYE
ncbi:MAG: glycoside hydrolase family 3 protein [Clostridiales bacterium]|nr:glycoside hydrolase family 3 protein [Clostridiales bacterium]